MSAEAPPKKRRFELALFAVPHAPLGAFSLPPIVFLPPFYAAQLGVPLELVSALFLAARALDIVIDPLLGSVQDHTRARFGRRKLWLALTTPVLMLATWAAFIGVGAGTSVYVLGAALFAFYLSYASMLIAHLGWASELRADYHGRTNVLGAVQLSAMLGAMLILLLPGLVRLNDWGDDADAVHVMGWTLILTTPVTVLIALLFVREPQAPPEPRVAFREALQAILTNRHLRGVLVPDLLFGIAQGVAGGLFLFYFQYALGFERESQTLLFVYFISGVLGVPLWVALAKRIGKHRALQAACFYAVIATLLIVFIPRGNLIPTLFMMLFAGLHQGSSNLLLRAMLADVVDADTLKTGAKRAGLFNGLLLTTSKIGIATGPITYAVLAAFDFDPSLGGGNSPEAMSALTWLFIGGPALIFALSGLSLYFYKLDEAGQKALRAEIEARAASAP
ncbi:MAG: MFS transporter [Hyphomonadaceae bacterium]